MKLFKPFNNQKYRYSCIPFIAMIAVCFMLSLNLQAQFIDDFSDGNFTSDPAWNGDTTKFKVNSNFQLQLNDDTEEESYLATSNHDMISTEWQFWIKLSFSPSANNNARVYLVSDNNNLQSDLNGYFLQFGESGLEDAIELFRQSGDESVSVCRGTDAFISSSFEMRVKVIRDETGNWEVFADPSGGTNFQPQASGQDNTFTGTEYFGINCKYTVSNSKKMYFDDFYAGPIIIDTIPPAVESITIQPPNGLEILFNEPVEETSAETTTNFILDPPMANPEYAFLDDNNPAIVYLTFDQTFINGTNYVLTIDNVEDLSGNKMQNVTENFSYFYPSSFDIVINEIMADPTPPVALPEFEYIELANNTDFPALLKDWTLTIGSSVKIFDEVVIPPQDYLILAKESAESSLGIYGNFYGFSSFSVTNSGQTITLRNEIGKLMSLVSFDKNWYGDTDKEEGGWSLEQIDLYNPCGGKDNWRASEKINGGSPGEINSVFKIVNDPPIIERLSFIDPKTIEVIFSQTMDSLSLLNSNAYQINHGIGLPAELTVSDVMFKTVRLEFSKEMEPLFIYQLSIEDTLFNCCGIPFFPDEEYKIGVPERAIQNDIVINEILFNPKGDGVDYVELYNRSGKILDLASFYFLEIQEDFPNGVDTSSVKISNRCNLIFPDKYLVLSENPDIVKQHYYTTNPDAFLQVDDFPNLNSDKGKVAIIYKDTVIDLMEYSEAMQYALLNYFDGVALERINYNRHSADKTNWHSASQTAGFGTPGYQNSQFVKEINIQDPIRIEPEIFSPDGDGKDDLLNIHYEFNEPGYTASILIFDDRGRLVRNLVNNKMLGTKGSFSWDGLNENNEKANIGIYVIFVEVFDLDGNVKKYKKTGVLGSRF